MASSASFVIYIESLTGLNFTVLASSDDDISSLKKKVEAQHLALSPQHGRIFVQDIMIIYTWKKFLKTECYLPDNIPVRCLFDGAKGIVSLFITTRDSPVSAETRNLCQNAGSDSFVIYIRSSGDFNFAVLASSDDDISSIKQKAAAQHLALFPEDGRIVAQAIKITHEGKEYSLPDNIPVHCLFDGAKGIRLLYMVAELVPSFEISTRVLDLCQNAGSDFFVIYIRSSSDLNFAVLTSSNDDISSIKKKAAAQHLALFPHDGRIVSQAMKIIQESQNIHESAKKLAYIVLDNIPVRCLFDGAKVIRLLYMDAVTVPLDLDLCQNGDPSGGRDHRSHDTNKDPVVAEH